MGTVDVSAKGERCIPWDQLKSPVIYRLPDEWLEILLVALTIEQNTFLIKRLLCIIMYILSSLMYILHITIYNYIINNECNLQNYLQLRKTIICDQQSKGRQELLPEHTSGELVWAIVHGQLGQQLLRVSLQHSLLR